MGNTAATCCASKDGELDKRTTATGDELRASDAVPDSQNSGAIAGCAIPRSAATATEFKVSDSQSYQISLDKARGLKLGLDVDYMAERMILPVMQVTQGGLAEDWNNTNPNVMIKKGDSIIEVNGVSGQVAVMLEKCKADQVLNIKMSRAMTCDHLVADLERLVAETKCGAILIRPCWNDAGISMQGVDAALSLLGPISKKYCPSLISNPDLWALAANVAIKAMGGPSVLTRYGRVDMKATSGNAASLPDGDKLIDHLRTVLQPKGFDDKEIVALSGATMRGSAGQRDQFDNMFFKEVLVKVGPAFTSHVQAYVDDQATWFADFAKAWTKLQEYSAGVQLRDVL